MSAPGPDKDGNPRRPVAPGKEADTGRRALEDLTSAVRSLQDTLVAERSTSQGSIIADQQAINERRFSARSPGGVALTPQAAREALQSQSRPPNETTEAPPEASYIPQPQLGLKSVLEKGWQARGEGKQGILNAAFNQPTEASPRARRDSQGRPSNMPPNSVGPEMDQEEMQAVEPDNPRTEVSGRRRNGPDRSPPSRYAGISEQQREEIAEEGIRIPQYGDWQLDTKLRLARDTALRYAENHPETAGGQLAGQVASIANYGYAHAAQMQYAKLQYQKVMGYGEAAQGAGESLGFTPQNGIGPSNILGFRNPLAMLSSSAGRQGLGMNIDAFSLARLGTGLSTKQAKEAYEAAFGMGFSNQESGLLGMTTGGDLNNVVNGFMAPLMREGASAQAVAPFTESLKSGTVSIKELSESLKNLGDTAQATRQTVDQTSAGIQQYTQTAISMGATPVQGINAAKGFMDITGLPSSTLEGALSSPMFQANAMARTGIMPMNIGQLPATQSTELMLEEINRLKNSFHLPSVRNSKGEVVVSGEKQDLGLIAQRMGMTTQQVESLTKREKPILANAKLQEAIGPGSKWNQAYADFQGEAKTRSHRATIHEELNERPEEAKKVREEYQNNEGSFSRNQGPATLTPYDRKVLQEGGYVHGEYIQGRKQIYQDLKGAGAKKSELEEYQKANNQSASKVAEKLEAKLGIPKLGSGNTVNANGVTIGLTAQAAKALKIEGGSSAERAANSGGSSLASQAAAPLGPASTIPQYSSE